MFNIIFGFLIGFVVGSVLILNIIYNTIVKKQDKQIDFQNKLIDEYHQNQIDYAYKIRRDVGNNKTIAIWDKNTGKPLFVASPYKEEKEHD